MKEPKPDIGGNGSGPQTPIDMKQTSLSKRCRSEGVADQADVDVQNETFGDDILDDDEMPGLADPSDDDSDQEASVPSNL